MPTVQTVTGPISTNDMGFTLMHEHVLTFDWAMRAAVQGWIDREKAVNKAVAELKKAKERGVKTIVDITPVNLGRDISVIKEVAEKTEMQIIAATGFYHMEMPWMNGWTAEQIAEYLLPDITEGIEGTDSQAAIIKTATDLPGVTDGNRKLLRVASLLHHATGVPISTHTAVANQSGLAQQEVFEEEGVDLGRVIIGHCGDSDDIDYLKRVLDRGSFIGMDRFGIEIRLPFEQRVATVARLCELGYVSQMVLSHDYNPTIDWYPEDVLEAMREETVTKGRPLISYCHISDDVIPALKQLGVSDGDIHTMMVDNPRRIFEMQGSY